MSNQTQLMKDSVTGIFPASISAGVESPTCMVWMGCASIGRITRDNQLIMSSVVLATAGYDHTIRFWEATSGICYRTLQYADSQVNKLEITSDKTQIAAAGNGSIRVFDVNSNDTQPVNTYEGHSGNVTAIGFQKDTKWMFSGKPVVVPSHRLINHVPMLELPTP